MFRTFDQPVWASPARGARQCRVRDRARGASVWGRGSVLLLALVLLPGTVHGADKNGVSPTAISLPGGPGTIEGLGESFQPALNTGTAKYGLAVRLPAGTADHTPQVRLAYEGGSGNGPVGFGWQLPVPFIQRRSDRGIPTYGESVGFARTDTFINEMREELVPLANGDHFCENEGAFIRYRRLGDQWEGTLPNGTRLEFGMTAEGRLEDPTTGRIFSWLLQRETDTRGNTIVYAYAEFPGAQNQRQKYLSTISYGPGQPPWDHFHFVRFQYADRADWYEDCRAGFAVRTGKRLTEIVVGTQTTALPNHRAGDFNGDGTTDFLSRKYRLEYLDETGVESHWSFLSRVTVIGADDVSTLPPATFTYNVSTPPPTLSAEGQALGGVNEPPLVMDDPRIDFIDLNADGLPDLLATEALGDTHTVFLNRGEFDFEGEAGIAWSSGQTLDSADGRAQQFSLRSTAPIAHLADMNGDGLADLVVTSLDGNVFYFANEGSVTWGSRQEMTVEDVAPPSPFGNPEVRVADLDFDKRMDVIQSLATGGGSDYRIWFNLGQQSYSPGIIVPQSDGFAFSASGVQIADLNGDRVPDVARVLPEMVRVTAGLGYGRFGESIPMPIPDLMLDEAQIAGAKLADLNGDGLPDLVVERAGPGQLWYWLNLGNYSFANRRIITGMPTVLGPRTVVRWADLNGNGTIDLVYADSESSPRLRTVDIGALLNQGQPPNVLIGLANGIGRVTRIDYAPSSVFQLADLEAGRPWPDPMPHPVQVVSTVTDSDSLGHEYVTRFRYHNGYYDPVEKQFRGFAEAEQIEVGEATAPTLISRSFFDTGREHEALKGKLLALTVEQENGERFSVETNYWSMPPVTLYTGSNGVPVVFAHPTGQVRVFSELGKGTPRRLESEVFFDAFGNETTNANYGIVENGDRSSFKDERITVTDYALNTEAWIIRYPRSQEVRDFSGQVVSRREYFYDDDSFAGDNAGVVTLGNLTLQRDWIDPAVPGAHVEMARNRHDAFGNAILVLDPLAVAPGGVVDFAAGHVRAVDYDPDFHNYAVAETVHVGQGRTPLVYRAVHDPAFGTLLTGTDFNTNTITHTYDPFGRLMAIFKPGDDSEYPTSEYAYALAVPVGNEGVVNYVETRLLDQLPHSRASRAEHYMISREYTDGQGRKLMTRREAEPQAGQGGLVVVVSGATVFNARRTARDALNPYFVTGSETLDGLLDYESIEAPDWKGWFHVEGAQVELGLADAHKTSTEYDAQLRETRSLNPDGTFELTAYEPLATLALDANQANPASPHAGAGMRRVEDGLGRLTRVDEIVRLNDDGTAAGQPRAWTTLYEYDVNDQLTRITDSQGNVKLLAYDGLRRKVLLNDPDRGLMRYRYDAAGNTIETQDAKGQRITFTYDGANRLLSRDYHDGDPGLPAYDPALPITPVNRPDVAYFYDVPVPDLDLGDGTTMTARNTAGLLAYVWDLTGEEHYDYDARETTTAVVKRVYDPVHGKLVAFRTGYRADALNRLIGVLYPDNDLVEYDYNERGLGRSIRGAAGVDIISRMEYSPAGQLTSVVYGNGVVTTSAYDANLRLSSIRTRHPALGLDYLDLAYEFDRASNIKFILDRRPGAVVPDGNPRRNNQSVEYDDLYRMTGVGYSFAAPGAPARNDGQIHYRYDRIGNLLEQRSDIAHFDQDHSVTDLGALEYGGAAGRFDRTGRAADDPPGPHALTSVRGTAVRERDFSYDANGNMLELDGMQATWDFDDRLVTLENGAMRADYRYDHRDNRIVKRVTAKGAPVPAGNNSGNVVYVNQYFEVREDDTPTKYVWCANSRIARVHGMLSNRSRLQRLRLHEGWNLCALAVSVDQAGAQLARPGLIRALYRWEAVTGEFLEVQSGESLPAGTVLWLQSVGDQTVAVLGAQAEWTPGSGAAAGGAFHPGGGFLGLNLERFAPAEASIWRFDAVTQRWQARLAGALANVSDLPVGLASGEALFLRAARDVTLTLPDPALNLRYYHQDHLGSSALLTDRDGRLIEETALYPFGYPRHRQGALDQPEPYQFVQKEQDRESGLNLLDARYQSPVLGRFLRVDPLAGAMKSSWLEEPQRLNLYAYCANSPLGNADASGLDLVAAFKGFGIGVAEGVWDSVPKHLDPVTASVSFTVGVVELAKQKSVQFGGVMVETYNGNYKKAAVLALVDERVAKVLDPTTSDEAMGRTIGNETGKALVIVASAKAGAGGGPKSPAPPPPRPPPPPPARVVVGRPMTPSGQVGTTQPAMAKGPTTKVAQPVENPTQPGKLGHARDVAQEARIAENNRQAQSIADRMNKRMRETQELRDWLFKEGKHDLLRKYTGDLLNE